MPRGPVRPDGGEAVNRRQRRNRDTFWAEKLRAARAPDDAAAVAWDQVRAAVNRLPKEQRSQAWAQVRDGLAGLRESITDGHFTSGVRSGL
jgi:hypothetical protein